MVTRSVGRASAVLAMLALLLPGPAAARSPGLAATTVPDDHLDCATEAYAYPDRWHAEGATFLGTVTSTWRVNSITRAFRFTVEHAWAGDIGQTITLRATCVATRFTVGERYLVSSRGFWPATGPIRAVAFGSGIAVAWHVGDDGSIALKGYGAPPGDPADAYLTEPATLYEAVHAVALGKQKAGACDGGDDRRIGHWRMEVDRVHGRLDVAVGIDPRSNLDWTLDLFQDYQPVAHVERTAGGPIDLARTLDDLSGTDRIGFVARQSDGELCRGVIHA